jgi:hypothetical protein
VLYNEAFSSEVGTGSREELKVRASENALKPWKYNTFLDFIKNKKCSGEREKNNAPDAAPQHGSAG